MNPEHLIAFNLILLTALSSPGAALLFAVRTSISGGRAAGILTGLGLATMAAGWTLLALLGLDRLFALFPIVYSALKIAGALYLIYVAYMTWRGAHNRIEQAAKPHGRAFLEGVLINLGNPKAVLFAAAVLVVIFPSGLSGADMALITFNHLVVEVLWYAAIAVILSGSRARARYIALKPVLDRIAATLLGALGLKLLADR